MSAFRDFIDSTLADQQSSDAKQLCRHCKKILPLDAFYKNADVCIPCAKEQSRKYRMSAKGQKTLKTYRDNFDKETMKASVKRYRQSAKGKETRRLYYQTPKSKAIEAAKAKRWRANNREKIQAHWAVKWAIRTNKLPRASTQQCTCGEPAQLWHHTHGYARENRLRVMALCRKCHQEHHNSTKSNPS
jgi:predicted SnoaL-like aldol condensation-catalyzing enzyme